MTPEESAHVLLGRQRPEASNPSFRTRVFAATESGVPGVKQNRPSGEGKESKGDAWLEPRWYAAYTRSRHEKTVAEITQRKSIETFLPLYDVVRRWRNGNHRVQLPLFPGYAFVRIALQHRQEVLKVPGVVCLVGFNGTPIALPDEEVERLRQAFSRGLKAAPHPYLTVGQRVRVTAGPLVGLQGILERRKGALRVILSIESIQRSIRVELPTEHLAPALEC